MTTTAKKKNKRIKIMKGYAKMNKSSIRNLAFAALLASAILPELHAELALQAPASNQGGDKRPAPAENPDSSEITSDGGKYDTLRFSGRDFLSGKIVSFVPDRALIWTHPDTDRPIEFKPTNLKEITISGKQLQAPAGTSTVRLTNGDVFKGSLVKLDKDNILIKTWYAGDIKISRKMLKEILPATTSSAIYEGPNDIKEWTVDNQRGGGDSSRKIEVSNKTLSIPGNCTAGRDMKIPEMAKIEFDMIFSPNSNVNIFLYSDQIARHQGNSYILNISSSYIYLQRYSRNEGSDSLGQGECRRMMEKSVAHFTLLVNKKQKTFTIMVNGAIVQQITDNRGEFCGKGGMISFYNSGGYGALKIRNILISKWDGRIPNAAAETEENVKDNIVFSNDDKVTGKLKTIENGQITFETEFASLNVPVDRARSIRFSNEGAQVAKRNTNDIKAFFTSDESITIDVQKIADGKISGKSENFGNADFLLNAFKKIALNIYAEPAEDEKEGNSDTGNGGPMILE